MYLRRSGYRILERNYRGPRYEVDVIARDGDIVVFIEVKTRQLGDVESGAMSIGAEKRRRIAQAAEHYLLTHPEARQARCRFDAVLLEAAPGGGPRVVELMKDAFR